MRLRPETREFLGNVRALLRAYHGRHASTDAALAYASALAARILSRKLRRMGMDPDSIEARQRGEKRIFSGRMRSARPSID